jgi:hypothetical protein
MQEVEVNGAVVEFPDDFTTEQMTDALLKAGLIGPTLGGGVVPADIPARPAPPALQAPPEFPAPGEAAAARREAIAEEAQARLEARSPFIAEGERPRERVQIPAEVAREKAPTRLLTAEGKPVSEAGSLPFVSVTELERAPIYQQPEGALLYTPEGLAAEQMRYPAPLAEAQPQRIAAMQRTPEGVREAEPLQQLGEAFKRQRLYTEEQARAEGISYAQDLADLERRVKAGEDVPFYDRAKVALSGIGMQAEPGGAIVESPMAALLRGGLGTLEALAAEGYFRGLGYEVDEAGRPVDPSDLGYAIARAREDLGLPAVVAPLEPLAEAIKPVATRLGVDAATIDHLARSVPQLALPLPGVATRSMDRAVTTFDPQGNRRVDTLEVPAPWDDWEGFKAAETRRLAQNIASGRSLGDEFLDAPDVAAWYDQTWGNPDAAWYAGTVGGLFMPAGPGLALKGAKGVAKGVGRAATPAARAATAAAIKAAEAVQSASPAASRAGRIAQAAALGATGALADVAAAVTPGAVADGRIVRTVARNVLDRAPISPAAREAAARAIQPTSQTTVDVLADIRSAMGLSDDFKRVAQQVIRQVPDDLVMVTDRVAVPRAQANQVRKAIASRVASELKKPWHARRLSALEGAERDAFVEALRQRAAVAVAPEVARHARDLTAAQVWMRGLGRALPEALDSLPMRRLLATAGALALDAETVSIAKTRQLIQGGARSALRVLGDELADSARKLGSVDEAIDRLLVDKTPELQPAQRWEKVLGALYGEDRAKAVLAAAQQRGLIPAADSIDFNPTQAQLRAIDADLAKAGALPSVGGILPARWFAPDFQKGALKVMLDEGLRKTIAKAGRQYQQLVDAVPALTSYAVEAPLGDLVKALPIDAGLLRRVGLSRRAPAAVYDVRQSHAEKVIADNGEEFAALLEAVSPRMRISAEQLVRDSAEYLLGGVARNVQRNAKYGYVLPNLPFLSYRLMSVPIVSLTTIGQQATVGAADRLLKRRLFGGGLTTPEGIAYTGQQLAELGARYGIGYGAVSAERIGTLADDLLREARRVSAEARGPGADAVRKALEEVNPLARSFWTRTAEAVDVSYRQAVFEAQLLAGRTPAEAADVARRSLLDYDEVPDFLRDGIARYMATAAGNWALATEAVRALMNNPQAATAAAKALQAQTRAQDPWGLHGDRGLRSLGILETDDGAFYGPEAPMFGAVETALGTVRRADELAGELRRQIDLARQDDAPATVVEAGARITRTLADEALPAVVALADAAAKGAGGEGLEGPSRATAEGQFWQAAMLAHHLDQDRSTGAWDQFLRIAKPIEVPPPKGLEHPRIPGAWRAVPPGGQPHLLWGRDEDGLPVYKVFAPSEAGQRNLELIRRATPEALQGALPLGAALLQGASIGEPGEAPEAIYGAPAAPGSLLGAAAAATLTPAGAGDVVARRREQAAALAEAAGAER